MQFSFLNSGIQTTGIESEVVRQPYPFRFLKVETAQGIHDLVEGNSAFGTGRLAQRRNGSHSADIGSPGREDSALFLDARTGIGQHIVRLLEKKRDGASERLRDKSDVSGASEGMIVESLRSIDGLRLSKMLLDRVGHLPSIGQHCATNFVRQHSKFKSQNATVNSANKAFFSGR